MYWFDIVNSSAFPRYKLIIFSLKLELLKIVLNTDLLLCHNEQSFMFYVSKTKRTCFIQYRAQLVQTMLSKTKQQVPAALSFFSHFLPRHLLQQNISIYSAMTKCWMPQNIKRINILSFTFLSRVDFSLWLFKIRKALENSASFSFRHRKLFHRFIE